MNQTMTDFCFSNVHGTTMECPTEKNFHRGAQFSDHYAIAHCMLLYGVVIDDRRDSRQRVFDHPQNNSRHGGGSAANRVEMIKSAISKIMSVSIEGSNRVEFSCSEQDFLEFLYRLAIMSCTFHARGEVSVHGEGMINVSDGQKSQYLAMVFPYLLAKTSNFFPPHFIPEGFFFVSF